MRIIEIDSIDDPRLVAYNNLTEVQLRNRLEPERGLFIAESPKVIDRALASGREPMSFLVERPWLDGMSTLFDGVDDRWGDDVPVYVASPEQLRKLTGYRLHRGALGAFRRWKLPTVEAVCQGARRIAVMENIVDPTNVGALMRSAAALDIDGVLVSPSCGDPLYRRAARVSMGTVFQVLWTRIVTPESDMNSIRTRGCNRDTVMQGTRDEAAECKDGAVRRTVTHEEENRWWPRRGLRQLHDLGFTTAAMALCDDSISLDELVRRLNNDERREDHIEKLALIFGTEGDGLSPRTVTGADLTVKIPMSHGVDSLNVAASSAVAFYATRVR